MQQDISAQPVTSGNQMDSKNTPLTYQQKDYPYTFVVVGGGYSGVAAVRAIIAQARRVKWSSDYYRIYLINKTPYLTLRAELDMVVSLETPMRLARIDLATLFKNDPVEVIVGEAIHHNVTDRTITFVSYGPLGTSAHSERISKTYCINYSACILAFGGQPIIPPVPGLKERAITAWKFEDFEELRTQLTDRLDRACHAQDSHQRKELLTFSVIGAGATGVEVAAALKQSAVAGALARNLNPLDVTVQIFDGLSSVLETLKPALTADAQPVLDKLQIDTYVGSMVEEITDNEIVLASGKRLCRGLTMFAGGARCYPIPTQGIELNKAGEVVIDLYLRIPQSYAFMAGDLSMSRLFGKSAAPHMLAQLAMISGETAGHNAFALASGAQMGLKKYVEKIQGQVVSIGELEAVGWTPFGSVQGRFGKFIKRLSHAHFWVIAGGLTFAVARWFDVSQTISNARKSALRMESLFAGKHRAQHMEKRSNTKTV